MTNKNGYTLTINHWVNSFSGHVNGTFKAPGKDPITYGSNIDSYGFNSHDGIGIGLTGGIRNEDDKFKPNKTTGYTPVLGKDYYQTTITLTEKQYNKALQRAQERDENHTLKNDDYDVIGQEGNCVDALQDILNAGNIPGTVADYIQEGFSLARGYAETLDVLTTETPHCIPGIESDSGANDNADKETDNSSYEKRLEEIVNAANEDTPEEPAATVAEESATEVSGIEAIANPVPENLTINPDLPSEPGWIEQAGEAVTDFAAGTVGAISTEITQEINQTIQGVRDLAHDLTGVEVEGYGSQRPREAASSADIQARAARNNIAVMLHVVAASSCNLRIIL